MPRFTHELHVLADFEDHKAGDIITGDDNVKALWLGPWTDRLKLVKRFDPAPPPRDDREDHQA